MFPCPLEERLGIRLIAYCIVHETSIYFVRNYVCGSLTHSRTLFCALFCLIPFFLLFLRLERPLLPADVQPPLGVRGERRLRLLRVPRLRRGVRARLRLRRRPVRQRVQDAQGRLRARDRRRRGRAGHMQ